MLLHLVRHGRPAIDETVPAAHWALDDDAGTEISQLNLSGHLPREGAWFTSPEPKARATTSLLARCEVMVVEDLREAERSWVEDFEAAAHESFRRPNVSVSPGWEPLRHAQLRTAFAVRAAVGSLPPGTSEAVMVGHGTAWTMLVADLTDNQPDVASWAGMTMPDHYCIDLDGRRLVSDWGEWRSGHGPYSA